MSGSIGDDSGQGTTAAAFLGAREPAKHAVECALRDVGNPLGELSTYLAIFDCARPTAAREGMDEWAFTKSRDGWRWLCMDRAGNPIKTSSRPLRTLVDCVRDAMKHGYSIIVAGRIRSRDG